MARDRTWDLRLESDKLPHETWFVAAFEEVMPLERIWVRCRVTGEALWGVGTTVNKQPGKAKLSWRSKLIIRTLSSPVVCFSLRLREKLHTSYSKCIILTAKILSFSAVHQGTSQKQLYSVLYAIHYPPYRFEGATLHHRLLWLDSLAHEDVCLDAMTCSRLLRSSLHPESCKSKKCLRITTFCARANLFPRVMPATSSLVVFSFVQQSLLHFILILDSWPSSVYGESAFVVCAILIRELWVLIAFIVGLVF